MAMRSSREADVSAHQALGLVGVAGGGDLDDGAVLGLAPAGTPACGHRRKPLNARTYE